MEFLARRRLHYLVFWALLVLGLTGGGTAGGQQASTAPAREDLPLNITADRLEVEQDQRLISFLHNVVARYKDMILYADLLKIFYEAKQPAAAEGRPPAKSASRGDDQASRAGSGAGSASPLGAVGMEKISRIEAVGKVRFVQGDRVATGEKAVYFAPEEKLVLMGNPQLWRGDNSLRGHEIVFYLKENRAVVTGEAKKRVEAVIHPSQKTPLPGGRDAGLP